MTADGRSMAGQAPASIMFIWAVNGHWAAEQSPTHLPLRYAAAAAAAAAAL